MTADRVSWIAGLTLMPVLLLSGQQPTGHPYFPLSVGNSWEYRVRVSIPRREESKVVWRVTKAEKNTAGSLVYQVWPTPMQADDAAMMLATTGTGIEEVSTRSLVLKWPLTIGDHWEGGGHVREGQSPPAFKVLSVGQACSVASKEFPDCAVVEERDPGTQMQTITTYAKGVGPVEYKYFRIRQGGKQEEVQTVRLDSYRIAQ
ncbi:hypothetical protein [Paludibaculum fermentans]|uniref:hypothetical protein n=1 Tax=Paludibaculum fermentans TaxID=1473598 RepID=UPI003EB740BB